MQDTTWRTLETSFRKPKKILNDHLNDYVQSLHFVLIGHPSIQTQISKLVRTKVDKMNVSGTANCETEHE